MFIIPRKSSVLISLVFTIIFMLAVIAGAAVMPWLSEILISTKNSIGNRAQITEAEKTVILIIAYMILATAAIADAFLFRLLLRVAHSLVFTPRSVFLVRSVSWFCMLAGLLFMLLSYWFVLSFIVGLTAIFVGICLRVVKNVIEEATSIKSENDLTV